MNRAPSTMSIRRRSLAALAALSLLLAACADNETVAPPTDGIGAPGGDSTGDARTSVATMKLCDLVDLEPLVATLASRTISSVPRTSRLVAVLTRPVRSVSRS